PADQRGDGVLELRPLHRNVDGLRARRLELRLGLGDIGSRRGTAFVAVRREPERCFEGSMCSMLSTVVVRTRSYWVVIRPSISSGFRPVNCHATAITGMSMLGKMSVGVRRTATTNVYGRCSATLTIHTLAPLRSGRDRGRVGVNALALLVAQALREARVALGMDDR